MPRPLTLDSAGAFAGAACRYWLDVFPAVRGEVQRLRARALTIPGDELRRIALENLALERGNLEGAAAFAAFAPPERRRGLVRAQVAFQATYDYVDSLAEQPYAVSPINARRLHCALIRAVNPSSPHLDYYAHHPDRDDGGYLTWLLDTCRGAIAGLPAHMLVLDPLRRATRRMVAYQARTDLALTSVHGRRALAAWADSQTPAGAELRWWETSAACGSSTLVFALLTAAADPRLTADAVRAIEGVYWPWVGALHVLLDSLVDRDDDVCAQRHSLVSHYRGTDELAMRMGAIATEAAHRAAAAGSEHSLILAGMAGFYLSDSRAWRAGARPAVEPVLGALGTSAAPAILLLAARRWPRSLLAARR